VASRFVFPVGAPGRAVAVPRVPSPRGSAHPIVVESLSATPRVFHLHNFLSHAEADALVAFSEHNTDPLYGLHRSTTGVEHEVLRATVFRGECPPPPKGGFCSPQTKGCDQRVAESEMRAREARRIPSLPLALFWARGTLEAAFLPYAQLIPCLWRRLTSHPPSRVLI
jgi:hypothetical protein